jgi:hypothetical protein
MTDPELNALEAELAAMSPADLSPALRGRIAAELTRPAITARWPRATLIALAAAACVALAFWLIPIHHDAPPTQVTTDPATSRLIAHGPIATVADYRRALAESPARLDTLLDAEASRPLCTPEPATTRAFARANSDF